jgi:hypothetical protein
MMVIHAALVAQWVQRISAGGPAVLAGDFNFQPDSAMYALYAHGTIDGEQHADSVPKPLAYDSTGWSPDLPRPMVSAYSAVLGEEPPLTNQARNKMTKGEMFSGTLDYIWYLPSGTSEKDGSGEGAGSSWSMRAVEVEELAHLADDESLPTLMEPSDHLLLAANFEIAQT